METRSADCTVAKHYAFKSSEQLASTQSLIRSPNETLIAGRLNLNYDLAVQVFRAAFVLFLPVSHIGCGIYFSETKVRPGPLPTHVSASDAHRNVVQSTRATPGDTRSRGLIYARRYLVAYTSKIEGFSNRACRAIADAYYRDKQLSVHIPLKSYLRQKSHPDPSPISSKMSS